ncbi:MAG: hypothetical protein RMK84_10400 [Oscillochloridaceae bacterium]|nr:hypothetical protein [Chloroflexaceae bacterium]MDW8390524.1 hypothetical protein [Oscillochloridaceae bacterium]
MPEEIRAVRQRPPTPEEEALNRWFEQQEKDPPKHLEEGAKQIITLVSALYGVIFGILALASDPLPAYLARPSVRVLGVVVVLGYLAALLAALVVVLPGAYRYARASQTQRERVFRALMARKLIGLRVALAAFGIGSAAFAALFVVVVFGA